MEYAIIFFGCALGCGLNLVCGFGFGVFCMTFLPYIMHSTKEAAALINIVTFCQAVILAVHYREHIEWRLLAAPLAAYIVTSSLTVRFASGLANDAMRILLGGFLLLLSLYFIFIAKRVRIAAKTRNGLIAGGVGGVMSGLFSIGGPPMSLYFSAATEEKEAYLATIQMYYVFSNAIVTVLRAASGVVTRSVLLSVPFGLGGMALGSLLGHTVFKRLRSDTIRMSMYVMMAASGAVMLITPLIR